MRGRTKEHNHKELLDLHPIGSPYKEEKVIGGNLDLDLLSLPQKIQKSLEELRVSKLKKVNNGGGNLQASLGFHWGRKAP
jgi:hypothetical protein